MSYQPHPILEYIRMMRIKGKKTEQGTIVYEGRLYSFKIKELTRRPQIDSRK